MMNPKVPFQAAVILVSILLLGLSGWILLGAAVGLLPWAGFLAGLLAWLHSRVLDGLSARSRNALAWTGAGAMVFMVIVLLVIRQG